MPQSSIFIGVGGNLASRFGPPLVTLRTAVETLCGDDVSLLAGSRWYRSAPQPPSSQPWYVNGVIEVATVLPPERLLARLHAIEARFERRRSGVNAARTVDLDLLACGATVTKEGGPVVLPHPRLHLRAFVLYPLAEIAPGWRHPRLGLDLATLISRLPAGQIARPYAPGPLVSEPGQSYKIEGGSGVERV